MRESPVDRENRHQKRESAARSPDNLNARSVPQKEPHLAAKATVLIRPKEGILDPQGEAVENALPALGFTGVTNVHIGRLVELEIEDPSQLTAMCEKLLANPLIEDYEVITGS